VLANIDTSQIVPKNVEGLKADPPPVFFSKGRLCSSASTAIPSGAAKPTCRRRQHQLGSVSARSDGPLQKRRSGWATDVGRMPAGKPASFSKLPADDNWKDVKAASLVRPSFRQMPGRVSTEPAEMILKGEPITRDRRRAAASVGQQHRQRRLPDRPHGPHLPSSLPVVLCARFYGASVRDANAPGGLQEHSARA
jgi:hypothetical protein